MSILVDERVDKIGYKRSSYRRAGLIPLKESGVMWGTYQVEWGGE
jgi:hypothetical protein